MKEKKDRLGNLIYQPKKSLKQRILCDFLGWHKAPKITKQSGINITGKCPRCGKDVMLDSQGNWF